MMTRPTRYTGIKEGAVQVIIAARTSGNTDWQLVPKHQWHQCEPTVDKVHSDHSSIADVEDTNIHFRPKVLGRQTYLNPQ